MTPRQTGELLGFLAGQIFAFGCAWLVIVFATVLIARVFGRRVALRDAVRSWWILGIVAALFIISVLGVR